MSKSGLASTWASWAPYFHGLLRMISAAILLTSGTVKLFGWPNPMPPEAGKLVLLSQVGIGGILEVVGGVLLLLGLCTRPVAFVLSGMMAVAYFQFHAPNGFWPTVNGGSPAILLCFIFLFLSAAGPGAWSLDAQLHKGRA